MSKYGRLAREVISGTIVIASAAAVAGCSDPPASGYIYSVNYNPPSSVYWPGSWYSSCSGGKYPSCYQVYDPGWTEYFPAEWQLDLCQQPGAPGNGNSCGWRDVDEHTYETVHLGEFWTSVAGVTPAGTQS